MHTESTGLQGTVEKILFKNEETGFAILRLQLPSNASVIIRGALATVQPGQTVRLEGAWQLHPTYGQQFVVSACTAQIPETLVGLQKYLSSGLIKGIGPVYAQKLIDYFGTQVLKIIDEMPQRLHEVPGIGYKRAEQIIQAWGEQKYIANIMVFLQEKGIATSLASRIFKQYGQQALLVVQENPYRLAEEIWGIGFKTADDVAQKLGFAFDCVQRVRAGILYILNQITTAGHLYSELEELKDKVTQILELPAERAQLLLKQALHQLYEQDAIKLVTHEGRHLLTLALNYHTEKAVANRLLGLLEHSSKRTFDLQAIYNQMRAQENGIALNEDQQRGIISCLEHKITIITGGPGTGKTTLIKKLLEVLHTQHCSYKLAAPTGRAAKRMSQGTGKPASTIHRLLEFDVSKMAFAVDAANALKTDMLIVDEASMLDIFLMHALLKALPHDAHLVLIGDTDQLPSVGAGNVLHDMLASGKIPHVRLTHIFRQAQDSMIVVNAHKVNRGEFPIAALEGARRDFIFIKETDPSNALPRMLDLFNTTFKRYHIDANEVAVLVPMHKGVVGTMHLNQELQKVLNPTPSASSLQSMGTTFKKGDRVMQLRNNYDKLVFNGDTGVIEEIDMQERIVQVRFGERTCLYSAEELNELVLAYALSIHKSQGSEYDAVIILLFMNHFMLLQRNLLYTAITRAKKLCILIGEPKAIAVAVKNGTVAERCTLLAAYITTSLTCR
jgi:exodeoxyribonuclease V alpha subunit